MKNILITIIAVAVSCNNLFAQQKHSKTSLFTSYKGKVMAGYQGWFNAEGDGAQRGWNHYRDYETTKTFEPGKTTVDLWPDVSEYKKTYATAFKHPDGRQAHVYSPWDYSSVDVHFKWMQEYGIDGVFVQRFITDLRTPVQRVAVNRVFGNALTASEKYKRAIAVMYDFSAMNDEEAQVVIDDWKKLVDSLGLTNRGDNQTYLYHNGKPLVALWGVGFSDRSHNKYRLSTIEKLIDFFQNDPVYGGCSILLGVPTYWRDLRQDTNPDPHLLDVIKKIDIVHPWAVGRVKAKQAYPQLLARIKDDMAWCKENKLDYVPVVYPGFSFHNMHLNMPPDWVPRDRGNFFWMFINGAISAGAEMLYVAMFDEMDEGTAIFKIDKNPPADGSIFVKFEDDIPNDYYLYLAGYAGKILRKEVPLPASVPLPKNASSAK